MTQRIFLSSPHMSKEKYELNYIQDAFDKNWITTMGENVTEFEQELARRMKVKAAAVLSSGTAAIHLALMAAGVGKGDIVFCQSLTFAASANPILYQHATPVFIDSEESTWNMCPERLKEAFETYPEVKAIIVVHLYGLSANMDKIMKVCNEYDVVVIEDAAESLGTLYKNQPSGTHGDYGVYSFNGNKIITTSGGGVLMSNDEEKIEKVKFWAAQSKDQARHYEHTELGYNYRMSNIAAGIGRGQLKVLDKRVEKKREIYEFYKKELSEVEGIGFMPKNVWNEPNYWLSCITLKGNLRPLDVIEALEEANIESRPIWKPMHLQPIFENYSFFGNGVSEQLFENGVCLPSDTKMTEQDLHRVVGIINELEGVS